jgi:CHAT domain-containing protein
VARAFVYAGARAMLVSHWAVDSAATAKLISAAVGFHRA